MHKRRLHHLLVQLRQVRYLYLVILFVISGATFVLSYRQNNLTAIRLRDEVLAVDQKNGDVEAALTNLREFTYGHMNANLANDNGIYPPIQLKYRYERLVAAEQAKVESQNSKLYTEAQEFCEQQVTSRVTINRVPCIQQYLDERGGGKITPQAIPDALYKFDFVSPVWSPDLAGWSLVSTVILGFMLLVRFVTERYLRMRLNG